MVLGRETCFKLNTETSTANEDFNTAVSGNLLELSVYTKAPVLKEFVHMLERQGVQKIADELFKAFGTSCGGATSSTSSADSTSTGLAVDTFISWLYHLLCADKLLKYKTEDTLKHKLDLSTPSSISLVQCQAYLQSVSERSAQRVCSVAFRPGDIVWNCKQCQKDSTCVLCQACYQDSNHEGHDVFFYHVVSEGGGCCDCGDAGAWDPKGFCSRHSAKHIDDDPCSSLPKGLMESAQVIMAKCVEFIGKTSSMEPCRLIIEEDGSNNPIEKERVLAAIKQYQAAESRTVSRFVNYAQIEAVDRWLESGLNDEFNTLSPTLTSGNRSRGSRRRNNTSIFGIELSISEYIETNCSRRAKFMSRRKPLPLLFVSGSNFIAFRELCLNLSNIAGLQCRVVGENSKGATNLCIHIINWLLSVCQSSDGLTRILCKELLKRSKTSQTPFLETLVLRDPLLPLSLTGPLHDLYIRLLLDIEFKLQYAINYAKTYEGVYDAYLKDTPKLNLSGVENMIFGLSVQFLNRASFVELLVTKYELFEHMFASFWRLVDLASPNSERVDVNHPIITERKYSSLTTDLRYVLQVEGMAKRLCTEQNSQMSQWYEILARIQLVDSQLRQTGEHIIYEANTWSTAFHLDVNIANIFNYIVQWICETPTSEQHKQDCFYVLSGASRYEIQYFEEFDFTSALIKWLNMYYPAKESFRLEQGTDSIFPYFTWDVLSKPTSFHIPLHRFFSLLLCSCIQSTNDDAILAHILGNGSQAFWLGFLRFPLNTLVFSAQIDASLWRRNGETMEQRNSNYKLVPVCSNMRDLDIVALQVASMHLEPYLFLKTIMCAFGIANLFDKQLEHLSSSVLLGEYRDSLLKSLLTLLTIIVTELPVPCRFKVDEGRSESFTAQTVTSSQYEFRREIIHTLATSPSTFSHLADSAGSAFKGSSQDSTEIELNRLLPRVAVEVKNNSNRMKPKLYELKRECWEEFNPFYHHYSHAEREKARERWIKMRKTECIEKPAFSGDSKLDGDVPRISPTPAVSLPPYGHKTFKDAQTALLLSRPFSYIIRSVLNNCLRRLFANNKKDIDAVKLEGDYVEIKKAFMVEPYSDNEHSSVDEIISLALHLLTIQIQVYDKLSSRACINYHVQASESGYAWNSSYKAQGHCFQNKGEDFLKYIVEGSTFTSSFNFDRDSANEISILHCALMCWYKARSKLEKINLESIRWLLFALKIRDKECSRIIKESYALYREQFQAKRHSLLSKKRKAQRHMMAKMKQSQLQAMKVLEKDFNSHENEKIRNKNSSIEDLILSDMTIKSECLECVICRDVCHSDKGDFSYIGNAQHSEVIISAVEGRFPRWCTKDTAVINLCGHAIHYPCLEDYVRSLGTTLDVNTRNLLPYEFLCPLCKSLSNICVPHIPNHLMQSSSSQENDFIAQSYSIDMAVELVPNMNSEIAENLYNIPIEIYVPLLRFVCKSRKLACFGFSTMLDTLPEIDTLLNPQHTNSRKVDQLFDEVLGSAISAIVYTVIAKVEVGRRYNYKSIPGKELASLRRIVRSILALMAYRPNSASRITDNLSKLLGTGCVDKSSFLFQSGLGTLNYSAELLFFLMMLTNPHKHVEMYFALTYMLRFNQALIDCDSSCSTPREIDQNQLASLRAELMSKIAREFPERNVGTRISEESLLRYCTSELSKLFQRLSVLYSLFSQDNGEDLNITQRISGLTEREFVLQFIPKTSKALSMYKTWTTSSSNIFHSVKAKREVAPLELRPLFRLNHSYTELYSRVHQEICTECKGPAHDRAICLICGQVLLAGRHDRIGSSGAILNENHYGECTKHAINKHGGSCIVYLFQKPSILLIKDVRSAFWPSIYTDQHGEDQRAASRSLPMFFDEERFEEVQRLWFEQRIGYEVLSRRNKGSAIIHLAYY